MRSRRSSDDSSRLPEEPSPAVNTMTGEFRFTNPSLQPRPSGSTTLTKRKNSLVDMVKGLQPPISPLLRNVSSKELVASAKRRSLNLEQLLYSRKPHDSTSPFTMEELLAIKRKLDAIQIIQRAYRDYRVNKKLVFALDSSTDSFKLAEDCSLPSMSVSRHEPSPISTAVERGLFSPVGDLLEEY